MAGPEGKTVNFVSQDSHCFPRVICCIAKHNKINSGQHFAGNSELFPV